MLNAKSAHQKDIRTGKATLEHRHFATIAAIIRNNFHGDEFERANVANTFARELRGTNPKFDSERFIRACMGEG